MHTCLKCTINCKEEIKNNVLFKACLATALLQHSSIFHLQTVAQIRVLINCGFAFSFSSQMGF